MRHRLHQIGTGAILPITLPLDAERIVLMIAHRDLQVRQVDLALEPSRGRNADMVETRSREYPHFFPLGSNRNCFGLGAYSGSAGEVQKLVRRRRMAHWCTTSRLVTWRDFFANSKNRRPTRSPCR